MPCPLSVVAAQDPLGVFERWLQVVAQEPALAELLLVLLVGLLGLLLLGVLRRQARLLAQREALQDLCLGTELSLAGDHEVAAERLASVVERDPRNAEARILLGNSLRALGKPADAHAQHLEVCRVLREGDRTATLAVALDLLDRDTAADAIAPLESLLVRDPRDIEVLRLLVAARRAAGLLGEAADAVAQLRALADDRDAPRLLQQEAALRLQAGQARLDQERPDLAVPQLERALALDPLLLEARAALVTALSRGGRAEAAAAALGAGLRALAQAHAPSLPGSDPAPPTLLPAGPAPAAPGGDPLALPAARALAVRWVVQRAPYRCGHCAAPRADNLGPCAVCGSALSAVTALPEVAHALGAVQEVMDEIEETRAHVRKLVRWLGDPDPERRESARRKLLELGERAVEECFDAAVRSADRSAIAAVLHGMGPDVLPALVAAFQSYSQRSGVLSGLLPGRSAVQALSDLVRGFGAGALPFFQRWLGTEDRDLRKVVLDYFLGLADDGELESLKHWFPAVEILLRINQMDPDAVVRLASAARPGGFLAVLLGDEAFRHDEALLGAFCATPDRGALREVLARRGFSTQVVAGLIEALNEPRLRTDAREALAHQARAALDQLVAAFADQDRPAEARGEVRELLLRLGTAAVREVCTCFGPDPAPLDGDVVALLVQMGAPVLPELEDILRPRGWLGWLVPLRTRPDHPRARVIEAIGRIGGVAAEQLLGRLLQREGEPRLRTEIERWLRPGATGAAP